MKVTDDDVRRIIAEVDTDGSGTVGLHEFLLLSIPGGSGRRGKAPVRNYRPIEVQKLMQHTLYESTIIQRSNSAPRPVLLEIPEQCFKGYGDDLGTDGGNDKMSLGASKAAAAAELVVECRLNFKAPIGDRLAWSADARSGSLTFPASVVRDRWRERALMYREVVRSRAPDGGAQITFVLEPPPNPPVPCLQKIWGVVLPREGAGPAVSTGGQPAPPPVPAVAEGLDAFAVVSAGPEHVTVVDGGDGEAGEDAPSPAVGFATPSGTVRVVCGGEGTAVRDVRRRVAAACFLPPWMPLLLSYRRRQRTPPGGAVGGGRQEEQRSLEVPLRVQAARWWASRRAGATALTLLCPLLRLHSAPISQSARLRVAIGAVASCAPRHRACANRSLVGSGGGRLAEPRLVQTEKIMQKATIGHGARCPSNAEARTPVT